jgi:hypothetical protein
MEQTSPFYRFGLEGKNSDVQSLRLRRLPKLDFDPVPTAKRIQLASERILGDAFRR